ncbi:uncharacterized protein V1510DRAFT_417480 [Dipodascopsis tothii]|uniref:uncharacterized protein n=1 Tax=Dipodascopsis tothii TaxID=44089 RepID=UPI0034CE5F1E
MDDDSDSVLNYGSGSGSGRHEDDYLAEHFDFDMATNSPLESYEEITQRALGSHSQIDQPSALFVRPGRAGAPLKQEPFVARPLDGKQPHVPAGPAPEALAVSDSVAPAAGASVDAVDVKTEPASRDGLAFSPTAPGHEKLVMQQGRPTDWKPPAHMPDFNPEDWADAELPYKLSVSTDTVKSRVETQIKAMLTFEPPPGALFVHLPASTIAKPRQQLRKTFEPDDKTLDLDVVVVCDHNRYRYINVCTGCINRERKRASRKKQPTVDDTHWLENGEGRGIMFNCSELLEISPKASAAAGASDGVKHVELPMRIPCYCRHHAERTGFRVYFVVKDHTGKVVARAFTNPIMITDDHKTTNANARKKSTYAQSMSADVPDSPEERSYADQGQINTKKRKSSSRTSTSSTHSAGPVAGVPNGNVWMPNNMASPNYPPQRQRVAPNGDLSIAAAGIPPPSSQAILTPLTVGQQQLQFQPDRRVSGESFAYFNNTQTTQPSPVQTSPFSQPSPSASSNASTPPESCFTPLQAKNPNASLGLDVPITITSAAISAYAPAPGMMAGNPNASVESSTLQRLIPMEGPIRGGIEVTVLGTGFHQGLIVMFGDQPAAKTHIWSESTIVAILPPASTPGPVVVRLRNVVTSEFSKDNLKLFTYVDDTDRQLMELALQVVGLKMTGRLEDARQIAMKIVGQTGSGSDSANGNMATVEGNFATSLAGETSEMEKTLLKCLDLVDYSETPYKVHWQHRNGAGQTMMHLAVVLGFQRLVAALVARGASHRVADHAGFSPLHFASMLGNVEIAQRLLNSDANPVRESHAGLTAIDVASTAEMRALLLKYAPSGAGERAGRASLSAAVRRVEDFPDWPTSSGPSSPASSTDDYSDSEDESDSDSAGLPERRLRSGAPDDEDPSESDPSDSSDASESSDSDGEDADDADERLQEAEDGEGVRGALVRRKNTLTYGADKPAKEAGAEAAPDKAKRRPWSKKRIQGLLQRHARREDSEADDDGSETDGHLSRHQRIAGYLGGIRARAMDKMQATHLTENLKDNVHDALTAFNNRLPTLPYINDYFSSDKSQTAAPPSYDEIYPDGSPKTKPADGVALDKGGVLALAAEGSAQASATAEQDPYTKFWERRRKNNIRDDLMLFLFWLPVLCFFVVYLIMKMFGVHLVEYIPLPKRVSDLLLLNRAVET